GKNQINFLSSNQFDVLVVGEVAEWETSEYIRDATFGGLNRGLVILGHAVSEEPGMKYLVEWLKPRIPEMPIHHVAAQEAFIPV
ncbi:MAG: Nif3-like dinuclear metal center hexameric protein, partial [Cyclobacteriaceae bacterium]